jgi:hypothetical protein
LVAVALFSAGLFAACASGNDAENSSGLGGAGSESSTVGSTGPGVMPTGPGTTGVGGNTGTGGTAPAGCASTCATDTQCQSSCEQPTSGIYCCDTANSMCYLSSQSECGGGTGGGTTASSSSGY